MTKSKSNTELIQMILGDSEEIKVEEEEILHLLLEQKISKNTGKKEDMSRGARISDSVAKFVGSWTFIISFIVCLVLWITVNSLLMSKAFDVYPFILLNLMLSCVAAIQAPVIMMSQNRQEEKDRIRNQNDYKTNLKAEIIIEDLHKKMDEMLANQKKIISRMEELENGAKRAK
jgi:uncharacterized membrane protein